MIIKKTLKPADFEIIYTPVSSIKHPSQFTALVIDLAHVYVFQNYI